MLTTLDHCFESWSGLIGLSWKDHMPVWVHQWPKWKPARGFSFSAYFSCRRFEEEVETGELGHQYFHKAR